MKYNLDIFDSEGYFKFRNYIGLNRYLKSSEDLDKRNMDDDFLEYLDTIVDKENVERMFKYCATHGKVFIDDLSLKEAKAIIKIMCNINTDSFNYLDCIKFSEGYNLGVKVLRCPIPNCTAGHLQVLVRYYLSGRNPKDLIPNIEELYNKYTIDELKEMIRLASIYTKTKYDIQAIILLVLYRGKDIKLSKDLAERVQDYIGGKGMFFEDGGITELDFKYKDYIGEFRYLLNKDYFSKFRSEEELLKEFRTVYDEKNVIMAVDKVNIKHSLPFIDLSERELGDVFEYCYNNIKGTKLKYKDMVDFCSSEDSGYTEKVCSCLTLTKGMVNMIIKYLKDGNQIDDLITNTKYYKERITTEDVLNCSTLDLRVICVLLAPGEVLKEIPNEVQKEVLNYLQSEFKLFMSK